MTNVSGRRANGEGSLVYLKAKDRWRGSFTDQTGKRCYTPLGKTRAEAARNLEAAKRASQEGRAWGSGQQRLDEFLAWWLAEVVNPNLSVQTYTSYEMHARRHILPALGRYRLDRLSHQHVQQLINDLALTYQPRTVKLVRAILRAALTEARRARYVTQNVADLVRLPKISRATRPLWSAAEMRQFVERIEGDPYAALYLVTLSRGLRQGEVLGLTWADITPTHLSVTQTLGWEHGVPYLGPPKTASSVRTMVLPALAAEVLHAHRARQLADRLAAPDWQNEWDLVFTRPDGGPLRGSGVTRQFEATTVALGLPRIRFHDLRHLIGTLLWDEGVDGKLIQLLMGHSSISTTHDIYIHPTSPSRITADVTDALLGGN